MNLALNDYQKKSLAALETVFGAARGATSEAHVAAAFVHARREALGEAAPNLLYRPPSREGPQIPHLYSADDAREKRDIGSVWAAASGRRCLFKMVTDATVAGKPVAAQLRDALSGSQERHKAKHYFLKNG